MAHLLQFWDRDWLFFLLLFLFSGRAVMNRIVHHYWVLLDDKCSSQVLLRIFKNVLGIGEGFNKLALMVSSGRILLFLWRKNPLVCLVYRLIFYIPIGPIYSVTAIFDQFFVVFRVSGVFSPEPGQLSKKITDSFSTASLVYGNCDTAVSLIPILSLFFHFLAVSHIFVGFGWGYHLLNSRNNIGGFHAETAFFLVVFGKNL